MSSVSSGRRIMVLGTTLSLFLLISFAACIIFGLIFPAGLEMHRAWGPWLPGFTWLTPRGIAAGVAWCVAYGFWTALILVPLRHFVNTLFGQPMRASDID